MAESTDPTKTKGQATNTEADGSELSAEQLDGMILSADPSFAEDLKTAQSIPANPGVDLEVVDLGQTFTEVENPWKHAIGVRGFIVKVLPFLPGFWDWRYRFLTNLKLRIKTVIFNFGPWLLQTAKTSAKNFTEFLKGRVAAFKALNGRQKAIAATLIVSTVLTAAFVYRSFTHGVLPPEKEMLISSLDELAVQTYKYDAESEMDSFYDSPRTIQNIMSIPKIIVNIQPSASSSENPMAAMEFFIEGLSPEVIVEVKDSKTEMRDLFQRTLEEMSYDELDTTEGKQQLTEKLRGTLNGHLTKGKIRRVFIKEMVLKP